MRPEFARLDGQWVIFGVARDLEPGREHLINRVTSGFWGDPVAVRIGAAIAERTIEHRARGSVRYLMTEFEALPSPDEFDRGDP